MEVLHERCCGGDVHKQFITACLIVPGSTGKATKEIQTFRTMTADLERFRDWLQEAGCTHVAMESTGVLWKPIYNLLEETEMTALVVNPHKIKAIPGRKTDVKDAEWIATLLRRDMLPASFIPDRDQRELQELVRYRQSLVQERTREANRIRKVLEGANVKLGSVVSDIQGASSRAMLEAIVRGVTDPEELIPLAKPTLRATPDEVRAALQSLVRSHQRLMLKEQLAHLEELNARIARLDGEIEERMRPFASRIEELDKIPGVGRVIAQEIIAAIGVDMSRFPSERQLASWAKVCPGTNESAGKRSSASTGKGNRYLRTALVEAAQAAGRKRGTYLYAQYHRLAARIGKKKATVAVAHSILVIAYHILRDGVAFEELGADYFVHRNPEATKRRAVRQLEDLGYKVTLEEAA